MKLRFIRLVSFAFVCIALMSSTVSAQKNMLTMEDAVLGLRGGKLMPDNLKQLQWIPESNIYAYAEDDKIITVNATNQNKSTLFTLANLNENLGEDEKLKALPTIHWLSTISFMFKTKQTYYKAALQGSNILLQKFAEIPPTAANITLHKPSLQIAYTIDNNLYVVNSSMHISIITTDPSPTIINGQAVHRSEFGIHDGIFFSPKGNYIAFYRMDESMVADYPIINWQKTPAENKNIKYPMSGGTSHHVTVGVFDAQNGNTIFLKTGEPNDQYLTCVSWSPDEKNVFVGMLNREQNHLRMNRYNAITGDMEKILFEEKHDKYVEPQHSLYFLNDDEFIWHSQRDGYMHLYRYHKDGRLLNQVTKGDWLVNSINGKDIKKSELIISTTKDSPLEKHLYAVNWKTGKLNKLETTAGIHTATVCDDGKYIIDHYQSSNIARQIDVINKDKNQRQNILTATDKLSQYQTAKVENITLKAADGTDLYGKLIYPTNFTPSDKYPTIVYLYNGPHVQLVTNGYPASGNLWYDYMAQKGYCVFVMDGRGSSNRGLAFEQATHKQLGQIEMQDQLQGVAYLKSLPFIDGNRLGVHGWSYGGFMTTSLMTQHPDVFKVGVAGGPVIEWDMYEIMYTERYMQTPTANPEGYKLTGLTEKAGNVKGKLLMIHGADDNVVVWQHSLKFIESSVKKGVQIDYYVYPGHEHNVLGKDRVHLMQKISDYFDDYLKK